MPVVPTLIAAIVPRIDNAAPSSADVIDRLDSLLKVRPPLATLETRNILTRVTSLERSLIAASSQRLSQLLSRRPQAEELMKKHILYTQPSAVAPQIQQATVRMGFVAKQKQLQSLLQQHQRGADGADKPTEAEAQLELSAISESAVEDAMSRIDRILLQTRQRSGETNNNDADPAGIFAAGDSLLTGASTSAHQK